MRETVQRHPKARACTRDERDPERVRGGQGEGARVEGGFEGGRGGRG